MECQSDDETVQFTPPDQIIPNTGGRFEDWEFHPSRVQALREFLDSQESPADGENQPDGPTAVAAGIYQRESKAMNV